MKDVFISYKAEEYDEANELKSILERNGISCWMAPASIPGGSSYATEIPHAISEARVFVLVLSSKAQNSQWISKEIDLAINKGKIVLPFMLENCTLKDDFNFYLSNVQRYEAFENKSKAIEKMIREIKAILSAPQIPSGEGNGAASGTAPAAGNEKINQRYDVVSILSAFFGFLAALGNGLLLIPNIVAIILSFVGLKRIKNKFMKGKIFSVIGFILGIYTTMTALSTMFYDSGTFVGFIIGAVLTVIYIIKFRK